MNPVADFDRFLRTITHEFGDPTFSILKAHLLFEEALRASIARVLPQSSALNGARLSFAQLLAVARASAADVDPQSWHWEAIGKLNSMRNDLAHRLEESDRRRKADEFVSFCTAHLGPVPEAAITSIDQARGYSGPMYLEIDMVLAALFSFTVGMLRLADGFGHVTDLPAP